MIKATVTVMPKSTVLDPQGEAVCKAIHALGMGCVETVRIGKSIKLEIEGTNIEKTKSRLHEIGDSLLSNPVIEDYHIELELVSQSQ
ncbi:MAG: phosphoribosylformylglycinamidine synthase subunit PurS [Verrucomicrobiota bacterium]